MFIKLDKKYFLECRISLFRIHLTLSLFLTPEDNMNGQDIILLRTTPTSWKKNKYNKISFSNVFNKTENLLQNIFAKLLHKTQGLISPRF